MSRERAKVLNDEGIAAAQAGNSELAKQKLAPKFNKTPRGAFPGITSASSIGTWETLPRRCDASKGLRVGLRCHTETNLEGEGVCSKFTFPYRPDIASGTAGSCESNHAGRRSCVVGPPLLVNKRVFHKHFLTWSERQCSYRLKRFHSGRINALLCKYAASSKRCESPGFSTPAAFRPLFATFSGTSTEKCPHFKLRGGTIVYDGDTLEEATAKARQTSPDTADSELLVISKAAAGTTEVASFMEGDVRSCGEGGARGRNDGEDGTFGYAEKRLPWHWKENRPMRIEWKVSWKVIPPQPIDIADERVA